MLPDTLLDVSYVGLRGTHLRQDIDLNPRAAGVGTDASRQYQGYLEIYENANSGLSNYNALQTNVDTGIDKNFYLRKSNESMHSRLRGEFFNVLNHTQFNDPDVTVNDANFGGIYGAADPRIIQLALKFFY
ncbi:MAG: hypothetical protein ACLQVN_15875 [Bryobacteraceae bacterium]